MTIININGTRSSHYRDIGLNDWMAYKRLSSAPICSALGCNKLATDGAHVLKADSPDDKWYICPMCHSHNESPFPIELKADWTRRLVALSDL